MGGKLLAGAAPVMMFPHVYINLTLGNEKGEGGSQGSVGQPRRLHRRQRAAAGRAVEGRGRGGAAGCNNRLDQAYVETPDGVRMEILEDKTQSMPIRHEHVHLFLPEAEIAKAQAWYAKTWGGKASTRKQCARRRRAGRADPLQQGRQGADGHPESRPRPHRLRREGPRRLVKKIEAEGIKLDEPVRKSPTAAPSPTITDPWGTRIEIIERAPVTVN